MVLWQSFWQAPLLGVTSPCPAGTLMECRKWFQLRPGALSVTWYYKAVLSEAPIVNHQYLKLSTMFYSTMSHPLISKHLQLCFYQYPKAYHGRKCLEEFLKRYRNSRVDYQRICLESVRCPSQTNMLYAYYIFKFRHLTLSPRRPIPYVHVWTIIFHHAGVLIHLHAGVFAGF